MDVFDDRRLQTIAPFGQLVDLDIGQALGAVNFDEVGVRVDLTPAQTTGLACAARHAQGHHATALHIRGTREDFEVHIRHHIGEFGELHGDAQVRLIRTVLVHRIRVRHDGEFAQVHANRVLEHGDDQMLEDGADFFLGHKGSFDIDLRELGLAVCAQVFVAEALGELVIAVKTGHHEQLLEELRALRQRKELAVMHPTGHQVIACAFRRALGEHGGFDINKPVGIQKLAHLHRHAVAQDQVVLHIRTAQVQHPVRQACGLGEVFFIQLKGRRNRWVEYHQPVAQHLDFSAFEVVVLRAFGTRAYQAGDLDTKLIAQIFGDRKHLGAVRIANDLHIAFAVAQVDKNHATMVTPPVDPAAQGNGLTQKGFGHQTAIVGTHGHSFFLRAVRAAQIHKTSRGGVVGGCYRAHGQNVGQRFIHAHLQLDDFGSRQDQKVAAGGIGCGGYIHADKSLA